MSKHASPSVVCPERAGSTFWEVGWAALKRFHSFVRLRLGCLSMPELPTHLRRNMPCVAAAQVQNRSPELLAGTQPLCSCLQCTPVMQSDCVSAKDELSSQQIHALRR